MWKLVGISETYEIIANISRSLQTEYKYETIQICKFMIMINMLKRKVLLKQKCSNLPIYRFIVLLYIWEIYSYSKCPTPCMVKTLHAFRLSSISITAALLNCFNQRKKNTQEHEEYNNFFLQVKLSTYQVYKKRYNFAQTLL